MSALTPDCDPDLSNCGSPVDGPYTGGGPGVRSTVILLAVLAASVSLATGGTAPGAVVVLSGGVALVSGLVLTARCIRLAQRLGAAAAAHAPAAMRRSRPVG
ncbi:hypothetical protein [Blastococcus montanus]|uniref:hypothetical protein n=1 Tax=Blastococcus montanus TaxID=3144973 RepID=UPI00320A1BED